MKYIATLVLLVNTFFVFAQKNEFNNLEKFTIESKALGEERSFWVGLPYNYDSTKTYATLYVLDSETRYDIAYALSKELFQNHSKIPELIVVGIPHIDWPHRKKDLTFTSSNIGGNGEKDTIHFIDKSETGGGLSFLQHIENEIIPFVNKNYATNSFNVLTGHSLSGYFCAYVMPIQKSFSAFQIFDASVWYNSRHAIEHIKNNFPKDLKTNIYVSSGLYYEGDRKDVDYHLHSIDTLKEVLKTYPNINLGTKVYKEEGHVSMYMYSLIDGLSFLFKGCDYGFIAVDDKITVARYKDYYKNVSDRLGFKFSPPVDGFRWVAYSKFHQKNWQEAIYAYEECYHLFENDIAVNNEMSTCYKELNKLELSYKHRKRAKVLESK